MKWQLPVVNDAVVRSTEAGLLESTGVGVEVVASVDRVELGAIPEDDSTTGVVDPGSTAEEDSVAVVEVIAITTGVDGTAGPAHGTGLTVTVFAITTAAVDKTAVTNK